jgi:polyhydroxyalkanoate synthase
MASEGFPVPEGYVVTTTAFREFLRDIYQENRLYRNELELDGEQVDLGRITMPVLQVIGEYDHLIPPEASRPFNEVVGTDDTEVMEHSTGHIGLSVSSSSHEHLWPEVAEWFAARSADSADGDTPAGASDGEPSTAGDPDLEDLPGIGPAYASRLEAAGVTSVAALADADPVSLATDADVDEGRVRKWIEAATERTT